MKPNNVLKLRIFRLYVSIGSVLIACSLQAQDIGLNMPAASTSSLWSAAQILCLAALGAVFGLGGQLFRVIVGFKREIESAKPDNPQAYPTPVGIPLPPPAQPQQALPATGSRPTTKWTQWFDPVQFWTSLALGAIAGMAAAILMNEPTLDRTFVVACVCAGYAGSDFVEGLLLPRK